MVVGYDPHISFLKLLKAASYLERPGCLFVATNEDERLPCNGPVVYPGALRLCTYTIACMFSIKSDNCVTFVNEILEIGGNARVSRMYKL